MNTNNWRLSSRSAAAGLVLLLVATNPSAATAKIKPDWSKVEAARRGTPTTVWLYEDQAPPGERKIGGRFHSATAEAITLLLPAGQRRTLQKQVVKQVLFFRPLANRYEGWIALAVSATLASLAASAGHDSVDDESLGKGYLISHSVITLPVTAIAFLIAPKMGSVYNVPLDRRNDPTQTPSQHGWVTPADMRKAGSRLVDKASPGRLWLQAREARIRDGILLDSSTPARIHSLVKHGQLPYLVARERRTALKDP